MPSATTEGIVVEVRPEFWPERSDAQRGLWAFTYTIRISNRGDAAAKLLRRRWQVVDGTGKTEEIEGEGVVGKQPDLAPGESFEYTSWVALPTPIGTMEGTFSMQRADGSGFEAEVPRFVLRQDDALH